MKISERTAIIGVILVGIVLAILILKTEVAPVSGEHEEATAESGDVERGPHGGRLFDDQGYGLEVCIVKRGGQPEFHVYATQAGKPLPPSTTDLSILIERLGRKPQRLSFIPEGDYLKSTVAVDEPHSFKVSITARYQQATHRFDYEQIEGRVSMSDEQIAQNNIEILTAGPARIQSLLKLIGEIRLNEDRLVHVVPRLAGIAESATANVGESVRKGQLLALISSQALADQRSELLAAQKRLGLAQLTYEREKKLWADKISAEQDYLQARNALQEAEIVVQTAQQKLASLGSGTTSKGDLTTYEIRSPIDGVIIEKHLSLGEAVKDDSNIFVIADLSTVWAEMTIYAKDLNVVKIGQHATVKATAFDSESGGKVFYVGALVGEQSRTAKARIVLPNPDGIWRPGLPVNIEVLADEVSVPVAISNEAIQTEHDETVVYVRYGTDFEARPLALGRTDGRLTEVVKGLDAGELYAGKNSFLIKADLGKASAAHED
ncbi:efflux RND transporter periplasmic adaptor subunit [Methyloterricola oryzae]|uniref:efflux RND transporter periplasmic adaptor subunit n=1 Tax=Methyloterricola oryzae TaxID=1495050 RepID=UPI0005EB2FDF|nr:efflux RND transporter periplasmic adaptor subunit [Methyloterricola oryzae]